MSRPLKWSLSIAAVILIPLVAIGLYWYTLFGPGWAMQQTAQILVEDDKFGARAKAKAINCGDAILPLLVKESRDFEKLNWRNAFWISDVLGTINTGRSASLAHDLYLRTDRLQHVVGAAALAQQRRLDARGIDDLIATVRNDQIAPQAQLAIIALGKAGATRAAPVFMEVLAGQHADYWTDAYACDAIARIRSQAAIPTLRACLRSEEFHALPSAFRALVALGDRTALPLAIARVTPEIQHYNSGFVVKELELVTNQHFGYDRQAWLKWWNGVEATWRIPEAFRKPYDEQPELY